MTIEIPPQLYMRMGNAAVEKGMTPDDWAISIIEAHLAEEAESRRMEFEKAAAHVLEKNRELYERLARGPS